MGKKKLKLKKVVRYDRQYDTDFFKHGLFYLILSSTCAYWFYRFFSNRGWDDIHDANGFFEGFFEGFFGVIGVGCIFFSLLLIISLIISIVYLFKNRRVTWEEI